MSKLSLLLVCLILAPAFHFAKAETKEEDIESYGMALLMAADTYGPQMIKCNRQDLRSEMVYSVKFLLAAYQALNADLGEPVSPIEDQINKRNKLVCSIIKCSIPYSKKNASTMCDRKSEDGRPTAMWSFDYKVNAAKTRLEKMGIDSKTIEMAIRSDEESASCGHRAQHYQDAYLRSMRADDLVCFKKALERELQ